jgi:hypothetical protein
MYYLLPCHRTIAAQALQSTHSELDELDAPLAGVSSLLDTRINQLP